MEGGWSVPGRHDGHLQLDQAMQHAASLPVDFVPFGGFVDHPRRIGAGASIRSPIAVFTRPGSSTFAVRPVCVKFLHQPVRRRPCGDHPRWGARGYALSRG